MVIELTEQQQRALDSAGSTPPQVVDPRTEAEYVLIPAAEYESVREIIEDERQQKAIRSVAFKNAVGRMNEEPKDVDRRKGGTERGVDRQIRGVRRDGRVGLNPLSILSKITQRTE